MDIDTHSEFNSDCQSLTVAESELTNFSIYPIPTFDKLIIKTEGQGSFKLVNANGQDLLKGNLNIGENHLSLANLSSGVYFLNVINSNVREVRKVIKE